MGVQEYASKILANKSKYSPELVKELTLLGMQQAGIMLMAGILTVIYSQ